MNICVVGTGYVGLVTGTCFAEFGSNVICVDKDESKIAALNDGKVPIYEPGLDEMIERVGSDRLLFGTDWPFYPLAATHAKVLIVTEGRPEARADILRDNAERLFARAAR